MEETPPGSSDVGRTGVDRVSRGIAHRGRWRRAFRNPRHPAGDTDSNAGGHGYVHADPYANSHIHSSCYSDINAAAYGLAHSTFAHRHRHGHSVTIHADSDTVDYGHTYFHSGAYT